MDTAITFYEKNCHRKIRICFFKKVIEKIRLKDAFQENNEIIAFKISCTPDFQGKYVLRYSEQSPSDLHFSYTLYDLQLLPLFCSENL